MNTDREKTLSPACVSPLEGASGSSMGWNALCLAERSGRWLWQSHTRVDTAVAPLCDNCPAAAKDVREKSGSGMRDRARNMRVCFHGNLSGHNHLVWQNFPVDYETILPCSMQSTQVALRAEYWAAWGHRSLWMRWTSVELGHMMRERQRMESLGQQSTPGLSGIACNGNQIEHEKLKTNMQFKFCFKKYICVWIVPWWEAIIQGKQEYLSFPLVWLVMETGWEETDVVDK